MSVRGLQENSPKLYMNSNYHTLHLFTIPPNVKFFDPRY